MSLIYNLEEDIRFKQGEIRGERRGKIERKIAMLDELFRESKLKEEEYQTRLEPLKRKLAELK